MSVVYEQHCDTNHSRLPEHPFHRLRDSEIAAWQKQAAEVLMRGKNARSPSDSMSIDYSRMPG
jgi:hypothetical protein